VDVLEALDAVRAEREAQIEAALSGREDEPDDARRR
jgi:hypothetical protein